MKRKTIGIGLVLALLMITSSLNVGMTTADLRNGSEYGTIVVSKKVFNGNTWVDSINAVMGDIVKFNITVTYYNVSTTKYVNDIVVTDTLPACLVYVQTIQPQVPHPQLIGNKIIWNFSELQANLSNEESLSVVFTTEVVGCGENINTAMVNATEHCSGAKLTGTDTATVYVNPYFDVEKKVWDPNEGQGAWVDELDGVMLDQPVRFQITATYKGCQIMKCLLVKDCLPECCFSYADAVSIKIGGQVIQKTDPRYPEITVLEHQGDKTKIYWDWKNVSFTLLSGQSVVIEFNANISNYCYCEVTNHAWAKLWSCCDPQDILTDSDNVIIQCTPPPPKFEKLVKKGSTWVDERTAVIGSKVRFRLTLDYFGNYSLKNIKIVDHFPCSLEYADAATINQTAVSGDKKTVWWNLTEEVNITKPLILEYNALVVNETGGCCGGLNVANLTAKENISNLIYTFENTACVLAEENRPPSRPILNESSGGLTNQNINFFVLADNDQEGTVMYQFNWSGSLGNWSTAKPEGIWTSFTHKWGTAGTYNVKARAKDEYGAMSGWSNTIAVKITQGGNPPTPTGNITITAIKGGTKVTATIKNNGTKNASGVNWSISIVGQLFKKKNTADNGTFNLSKGISADVTLKVKFGFGRVTITVTAEKKGYGKDETTVSGFVLGPLIRIK